MQRTRRSVQHPETNEEEKVTACEGEHSHPKTRHQVRQVQSIPRVKDKGKGLLHRDFEPSTLKSPVQVCLIHLVIKSIFLSFLMYGWSFNDSTTDIHDTLIASLLFIFSHWLRDCNWYSWYFDSIFIVHYFSLTQRLTFTRQCYYYRFWTKLQKYVM